MKAPDFGEAARLEALHQYQILDTPPEVLFDDLARLGAQVCATPVAFITFVDDARQWFKSSIGVQAKEVSLDSGFCPFVVRSGETLVIADTLSQEQFATNPVVTGEPQVRFYAGTPLVTDEGQILGTLCVIDFVPRELTVAQLSALEALARQIVTQLKLRCIASDNTRLYEQAQLANKVREQVLQKMADAETAFLEVMRGVSATTGESFFYSLVQHLTSALNVEYALIGELAPAKAQEITTLAVCSRNEILGNFTYTLNNTPCQQVIEAQKLCFYSQGIPSHFPDNQLLNNWRVESYVATPLLDTTGYPLGLLVLMDTKPLENLKLIEVLLPIFASRGAAELERKRVEQERDRFFTVAADMLVVAGFDGYFQRVNPVWEQTLGWTAEELTSQQWLTFVHPDDREATIAEANLVFQGKETVAFENRYRCKDGSYRWISWKVRPFVKEQLLYGGATDITSRKQAEEAIRASEANFRRLAQTMPAMVWTNNSEGEATYVNERLEGFTGVAREQLLGWGWLEILHPSDRQAGQQLWQQCLESGLAFEQELRYRHKSGNYHWFYVRVEAVQDENGKIEHWLGASVEIEDRVRAQEALRQSEAHLRAIADTMPQIV